MSKKFKVDDHVRWNSEAGHVTGRSSRFTRAISTTRDTPITPPRTILNTKSRAITGNKRTAWAADAPVLRMPDVSNSTPSVRMY